MRIDMSFLSEPLHSSLPKLEPEIGVEDIGEVGEAGGGSFKDMFTEMMSAYDEASAVSKEKTAQLITGQLDDLSDLMVSGEKSGILFQLNLTTKNKVLEAYQEIMRTQL